MPFRFAAKYGLLTYPQCGDLDPWAVNDMLGRLGAECVIGRENHQAGGVHLHAFFMFERKFESRNVRVFDVDGHHPNIVRGYSTPEDGWAYATKDGDVVAGALECPRPRTEVSESSSKWARAILAETREEFFAIVAELDPRALCVSFGSLRAYADWKYRPARDPYITPEGISFDTSELPELDLWVQQTLSGFTGRPKSLILIGDTRLGKTLWARSLGRHAYFGGLFCLDESLEDVDYAVFDDMQGGLEFFHAYKFWLGAQKQFYATDKYRGKQLVNWGRPSIYISNTNPLADKGADVDWLMGNCVIVHVDRPIFRASTE
ncbi:spliced replication-associated protein [Dragonfly associated gemykibivirus 1]|uniref:Spliced replication-associated protein n=2 Tax=Dragonfly associated gemykibivirus 1 TaxID=1234887 RepID=K0A1L7_9VIRU|nr:spliced replication-associated protein [Dragonfly associated gemykibivirus 1]AFS65316.1 spliced replication-associated protein [Dragonfly associated gemykibivirus 1]